jgi:hypothetical protein
MYKFSQNSYQNFFERICTGNSKSRALCMLTVFVVYPCQSRDRPVPAPVAGSVWKTDRVLSRFTLAMRVHGACYRTHRPSNLCALSTSVCTNLGLDMWCCAYVCMRAHSRSPPPISSSHSTNECLCKVWARSAQSFGRLYWTEQNRPETRLHKYKTDTLGFSFVKVYGKLGTFHRI